MKILLLLFLAGLVSGSALVYAGDPVSPATPTTELQKLNAEYERKRAKALRPVTAWYRAELEALAKKIQTEERGVEDAKQSLAKTFWEDDQPELKAALLSRRWVWRSDEDAVGVALNFSANSSVHHSGLNGTWKITGPNEVTVQPDDDGAFVLRFNSSLTIFVGNRRGVTGELRWPEARRNNR